LATASSTTKTSRSVSRSVVRGDKLFNGTWGYDGAFMYSQIEQIAKAQSVSGPRFERILNANDSLFNPASQDFIGQTIPYRYTRGADRRARSRIVSFLFNRLCFSFAG
jgi:hypothetical protein